jgi:hypothetical protein
MTVINNDARNQYIANNGQTIFNYGFEIQANTNINVYQRAAGSEPNDALDVLTLGVDYTVTGVGVNTGGTIILSVGAAMGDIITLQGNAPPSRSTSFTPGGVIQAQNLNLEFDNDVLIYQTIMAILGYLTPKYPQSAIVEDFERVLPNLGANQVWQMNDTRDAIIASTMVSGEVFASHASGQGASLIGLHPLGTVQDFANGAFILRTSSVTMPNAQAMGALASGIVKNATGSGIQSISVSLTSLDALTMAANKLAYGSGSNTWALTDFTAFARTLLDDANAAAARTTLGVVIGTDVQAYNANLQSISGLGTAANKMIYTTGVNTWAETDVSPYSRTLFDNADLAAWQAQLGIPGGGGTFLQVANNLSDVADVATSVANLGLTIGVDTQGFSDTLESISPLGTMADVMLYTTGLNTWAEAAITALGRSIVAAATQADANTAIGSLPIAGGTMTGDLFLNGSPTMGSQAATKSYVDSVVQNDQLACLCMTETDQLAAWTYNNGASGVGATLTADVNGATTFDGIIPTNGQRVFVNLQTGNEEWQGPYTIVQGTGGTPTVLTRGTDYDVPGEMQAGDVFAVVQGTTWGASQWMMSQTSAITIGTTPITFTQLAGMGALLKANNLSDLPSAVTARANLGVAIGTNVQAYDATLQSLSALGTAADRIAYTTGVDTWAETPLTAFGRSLIDDADATAARSTLGVVIGTNVQAYDATLQSISALGTAADRMIYTTGVDTWAETAVTAFGRTWINLANSAAGLSNLGAAASSITVTGGGLATGGGDLTANRTITVTAASQSDMESDSSNTVVVTPGVMKYAPGIGKAWVNKVGNSTTINRSYNVSSTTHASTGTHVVNFTTSFSDAAFVTNANSLIAATLQWCIPQSQTTGTSSINTYNSGGTLTDPTQLHASYHGDF